MFFRIMFSRRYVLKYYVLGVMFSCSLGVLFLSILSKALCLKNILLDTLQALVSWVV